MSYDDFIQSLHRYGHMTRAEITAEIARPDIKIFDIIFAKLMLLAADGDQNAREAIFNRLWGKVKEIPGDQLATLEVQEVRKVPLEHLSRFVEQHLQQQRKVLHETRHGTQGSIEHRELVDEASGLHNEAESTETLHGSGDES